jgi:hypothetical protein
MTGVYFVVGGALGSIAVSAWIASASLSAIRDILRDILVELRKK